MKMKQKSYLILAKKIEALKYLLSSALLAAKTELVISTLMMIKAGEIDKAVEQLDQDQVDALMKYIYKGFENPGESGSTHLLVWHEKAYATGGVGSIVRVLTDRRKGLWGNWFKSEHSIH